MGIEINTNRIDGWKVKIRSCGWTEGHNAAYMQATEGGSTIIIYLVQTR